MLKRQVPLHSGLVVGQGGLVKTCTIREETADDELFMLESGHSGAMLDRLITLRRITQIGPLDNPPVEVTRHLTRVDFDLIELAQSTLDVELATEAGLVEAKPAGRDEPGGETPGAVEPDSRSDRAAAL